MILTLMSGWQLKAWQKESLMVTTSGKDMAASKQIKDQHQWGRLQASCNKLILMSFNL